MSHIVMKEISAISKLSHKNIVGYKGCWVEAEEPPTERVEKVLKKIQRLDRAKEFKGIKTKSFLEKNDCELDENEEEEDSDQAFRRKRAEQDDKLLCGENPNTLPIHS